MDCSPKLAVLTATLRQYGGFENDLLSLHTLEDSEHSRIQHNIVTLKLVLTAVLNLLSHSGLLLGVNSGLYR